MTLPDVAATFDPISELFVAQFARPPNLMEPNLRALTPFQRALLVIDGTVTKFIEAYTMEPIEIVRLDQDMRMLTTANEWLNASGGDPVVTRTVLLQGEYTRRVHAYAASLVCPDRISDELRSKLEEEGGGLGRILISSRLETRREILWFGREHVEDLPDDVLARTGTEFITRTYRIIYDGEPIMLINEKFPVAVDAKPSLQ